MNHLITSIPTGISAFMATNIDDIFILLLFFSQVNPLFRRRHIIMGQYLGFLALIFISLSGFFGGMLLPQSWIGILGIAPIILGIRSWLSSDSEDSDNHLELEPSKTNSFLSNILSPQTCSVAAVTFANGGDNIGIYVPLFANCTWASLGIILAIFLSLVGVWCYAAYRLADLPVMAKALNRYAPSFVPFVLVALGLSILNDNHTLQEPSLMMVTFIIAIVALILSSRNGEQSPVISRD